MLIRYLRAERAEKNEKNVGKTLQFFLYRMQIRSPDALQGAKVSEALRGYIAGGAASCVGSR